MSATTCLPPAAGATGARQLDRSAASSSSSTVAARQAAWRQPQLCRRQRRSLPVCSATEEDLDQQLQQDLERLRQRQQAAAGPSASTQASSAQQAGAASSSGGSGPLGGVKEAIDKVLIADFFFVLFALAWLGAALAERSTLQSTHLLDTWLSLWQWVFQPAIGVLMLGAIVSGAVGWAKENLGGSNAQR